MIGGFGGFVFFVISAVDPFFFEKLEGWAEVIKVAAPGVAVEGVDGFDQAGMFEAIVSEEVSDTAPVFLFDVGVVVFVVGS